MYKRIVYLAILILILLPRISFAAGVGFVPSTGLWFSKTEFTPQETVKIYTVIINNEYFKLSGLVGFYDNTELIDSVEVKNLSRDSAVQLKILWQPIEGSHVLGARFLRAVATDEQGKETTVALDKINSLTGAPLKIGSGTVVPVVQSTPASSGETPAQTSVQATTPSGQFTASAAVAGGTPVVVKKSGDKLVLAAEPFSSGNMAEGKSDPSLEESARAVFAKNREIIGKAERIAGTITTTAASAERAYGAAQSVIEQGRSVYTKGEEYWGKARPYVVKVQPYWEKISNHNEPKRVAIIVGGAVVFLWLLRRSIRRGEFRDRG